MPCFFSIVDENQDIFLFVASCCKLFVTLFCSESYESPEEFGSGVFVAGCDQNLAVAGCGQIFISCALPDTSMPLKIVLFIV